MMPPPPPHGPATGPGRLLVCLGDGAFHTRTELARCAGLRPDGLGRHLRAFGELGLAVRTVRGRGYRLDAPLEWLDRERIRKSLSSVARRALAAIDIRWSIDSTNRFLVERTGAVLPCGYALLAEGQTAGRGRRGRVWFSPFGRNIYLSLLWRYDRPPLALTGLSLVLGVAVARALTAAGVKGIGLKWPNDLIWRGRKLGGLLVEIVPEATGQTRIVAGVGVNVRMGSTGAQVIDQPWTDVAQAVAPQQPGRNRLVAAVLEELSGALTAFPEVGLEGVRAAWLRLDVLAGQPVTVQLGDKRITGTARGIDGQGALRVEVDDRVLSLAGGDVTVRTAP